MSLLFRSNLAKAIFLFAVMIFLSLSTSSPFQARVGAIGPSVVWAASGSPDETLNPPPTPPKRSARLIISAGSTADRSATPRQYLSVTGRELSARQLFGIVWRAYWATVRL
jgi:hypothetical protein